MSETLAHNQPEQEPAIVSYDQKEYANGVKHLYGIDEAGKEHHLKYADVAEQYGYELPEEGDTANPFQYRLHNGGELSLRFGARASAEEEAGVDAPETPAADTPSNPYLDKIKNGGSIAETRRRREEAKYEHATLAEKAQHGVKKTEGIASKRRAREHYLEWQAEAEEMRSRTNARRAQRDAQLEKEREERERKIEEHEKAVEEREKKVWQARMGIIDESEVPAVPVEISEQKPMTYAQLLRAAEKEQLHYAAHPSAKPEEPDPQEVVDASSHDSEELDADAQAENEAKEPEEQQISEEGAMHQRIIGLRQELDVLADQLRDNPIGIDDDFLADFAQLRQRYEQWRAAKLDNGESVDDSLYEQLVDRAGINQDNHNELVLLIEDAKGHEENQSEDSGDSENEETDETDETDEEIFGETNNDDTENKSRFARFSKGVRTGMIKAGMATAAVAGAIANTPRRANAWMDEKLPESWSPRKKRIIKTAAGVAILGLAAYSSSLLGDNGEAATSAQEATSGSNGIDTISELPSEEALEGASGGSEAPATDTTSGLPEGIDEQAGSVEANGEVSDVSPEDNTPEDQPEPGVNNGSDESTATTYSPEAAEVQMGEGWLQTFQELGVPAAERQRLLDQIGPQLVEMGVAYEDPTIGGFGISQVGELDPDVLDYITQEADNLGIRLRRR